MESTQKTLYEHFVRTGQTERASEILSRYPHFADMVKPVVIEEPVAIEEPEEVEEEEVESKPRAKSRKRK